MDDFFWWIDSLARSLEWEDRSRLSWAREVTGASRRQERLEQQKQVTSMLGEEHEAAINAEPPVHNPETGFTSGDEEGAVPHEHGGIEKQYSKNGEPCDHPGCRWTVKEDCPACEGEGIVQQHGLCSDCDGSGKTGKTLPTTPHAHPEPPKPYADQSKVQHQFPDGWSVKKTHTYGDLAYEGNMMTNCIREDAQEKGHCDSCEGSGVCNNCDGGQNECGECYGASTQTCDECNGHGSIECDDCSGSSIQATCNSCKGQGKGGPHEVCKTCENDKVGHDRNSAAGNPHEFEPKCAPCNGTGKHTEWTPGKETCDECYGTGKEDNGDRGSEPEGDCWKCEGEGQTDCETCEGEGKYTCGSCEGSGEHVCQHCDEGYVDCYECDGRGTCQSCDGSGGETHIGGPKHYYKPYTEDDAASFERAPGGAYSLRDSDNVPHVSFLHEGEGHIHDVLGRENNVKRPLKPEYQKRVLQYMQGKLPADKDAKCSECKGTKVQHQQDYTPCTDCEGRGRVTSDEEGVTQCKTCKGGGNVWKTNEVSCGVCKGTGDPTVKVGWGYGGQRSTYTGKDIDDIVAGTKPKPDVMLVAKHKTNPQETRGFKDAGEASDFMDQRDYIRTGCGDCNGSGKTLHDNGESVNTGSCRNCSGQGYTLEPTTKKETHDLYAIPTEQVGHSRIEYEPSSESWRVKDGKGAKINWEGGTRMNWNQLLPASGSGDERSGINFLPHEEHRRMRQGQPDYVNQVVPRVASVKEIWNECSLGHHHNARMVVDAKS